MRFEWACLTREGPSSAMVVRAGPGGGGNLSDADRQRPSSGLSPRIGTHPCVPQHFIGMHKWERWSLNLGEGDNGSLHLHCVCVWGGVPHRF